MQDWFLFSVTGVSISCMLLNKMEGVRSLKKIISLIMSLVILPCSIAVNAEETTSQAEVKNPVMKEFYVSTVGNDSNDGSAGSPFKTIEKAKQTVRAYNDNMTGDIVVNIAAGTYYLDSKLYFTTEDSASNGYSIIYKGADSENTVLSGGREITDWKLYDKSKNIWYADAKNIKSRQLFINGERRWRASTTNSPKLANEKGTGNYIIESNNTLSNIKNINDVEIIWKLSFSDYRMPIKGLEGDKIIMPKANDTYQQSASYPIMRLENAYEWLDEQGEWYLNTSENKVYYMPYDDEDLNKEHIIMPELDKLFDFEGKENDRVKGITVKELTMKDTTWLGPNDLDYGYANFQAGFCREFDEFYGDNDYYNVKSAVCAVYAEDIDIERCILKNLGGAGIWMRKGVKNSTAIGNLIYDVSQNGMMLGNTFPWQSQAEASLCDNIKFDNNVVHDVGIEYLGCVGIFGGLPRNSSISHNEVYNIPYTCISFGWGWMNEWPKAPEDNDKRTMLNDNNKVVGNYVHHGMLELADGGGIYTLGPVPELLVAENVVSNMGTNECFAYYNDNGTRWMTLRDNVCYDVTVALYSKGADNVYQNNWFDTSFENKNVIGDQLQGHSEYKALPVPDGHENKMIDNHIVKDGIFPDYIMMNAGPEYEYQDIKGLKGNKDENIAAKGSATVIREDGKTGRFMSGKDYRFAVDGNVSTEMRATGKDKHTIKIDLGAKRRLTRLRLLFGLNIPEEIKLTVSENAVDYTEIPIEELQKDNEIAIDGIVARNIQIQVMSGEMSIAELEAYADDFIPVVTAADKMANLTLVTFDDIQTHWAKSNIEYLASLGIIEGISESEFDPDSSITRAQWIVLLTRTLNIQKTPYCGDYSDVSKSDWFADNIQSAYDAGLLAKCFGGNSIMPDKAITRAETATTLDTVAFNKTEVNEGEEKIYTAADFTDLKGNSYIDSIEYILKNGIMRGQSDTIFNPDGNLTRAQAAVVLERVLSKTED